MIMDMVINGTSPSTVPDNINTTVKILNPSVDVQQLPSVSFVKKILSVTCIITKTLAALQLALKDKWQLYFIDTASQ